MPYRTTVPDCWKETLSIISAGNAEKKCVLWKGSEKGQFS